MADVIAFLREELSESLVCIAVRVVESFEVRIVVPSGVRPVRCSGYCKHLGWVPSSLVGNPRDGACSSHSAVAATNKMLVAAASGLAIAGVATVGYVNQ